MIGPNYQFFDAQMAWPDELEKIIRDDTREEDALVFRLSTGEPVVFMSLEVLSESGNDSLADFLRDALEKWEKREQAKNK